MLTFHILPPRRPISVKTPFRLSKLQRNVFAGAENDKLPPKPEIYLRNSQKLLKSMTEVISSIPFLIKN